MTRNASFVFFMLLAFSLSGCDRAEPVAKDVLIEKTRHWKEPKVAIWYYIGSKDGLDYFRHYDLGISEFYSIQTGEISLPRTFPLTKARE